MKKVLDPVKKVNFFQQVLLFLIGGLSVTVFALEPIEKPSLKEILSGLKETAAISKLYQDNLKSNTSLGWQSQAEKLYRLNEPVIKKWASTAQTSLSFRRGEIEDEKVLNAVVQLVQLSSLKMATEANKKNFLRVKEEAAIWFLFAADLSYEESSLIGLRLASVIRSLVLDQLEDIEKKQGSDHLKDPLWLAWALGIRSPWPIDRVILSEARRSLAKPYMKVIEKLAVELQKNTYQTAAQVLDKTSGGQAEALKPFRAMWREDEVEQMKIEINRIQSLRVRWAAVQYLVKTKTQPVKTADLVRVKILDQVPIDYKTGSEMSLEQAALH